MSAKEYIIWLADYEIEPWGDIRNDLQAATIVLSNIMPHTEDTIKLKDCMLNFEPEKKQTWQDMSKMLKGHTAAMGGKVK